MIGPKQTYLNCLRMKSILLLSVFLISAVSYAQIDLESQIPKEKTYDKSIIDATYGIQLYEPLNMALEGDSVRMENGYVVNNWKEDFYDDGTLLHRGYYIDGQLKVYKNYYPNGQVEREFKNIDGFRSLQKKFYADGTLKSEVKYMEGSALLWVDYYANGNMEFYEEFHKSFLYHNAKRSYYETGQEETVLKRVKKLNFTQNDFYNNGKTKQEGTLSYDLNAYDYYKTGKWTYYNKEGKATKEETYNNGKVAKTKDL